MSVVKFKISLVHLDQLHGKNDPLFTIDKPGLNNVLPSTLFNVVNNIVQHCFPLIQARQYCSILFTTMNNVGSKTLLNPTFINREVIIFDCV